MDYFLINDDALDLVTKVGIGRETTLSDHCPVYLHLTLTKVKKGRGFWRLNMDFPSEPNYDFGINNVIERVIKQYSKDTNASDPLNQEPTPNPFLVPYVLLHDVLLLESRSYTLKYAANQKEKMLRKVKELNRRIDEKADSVEPEDMEMVNLMKQEVQDIEDEHEMSIARKSFGKMQLEGEKPSQFFLR